MSMCKRIFLLNLYVQDSAFLVFFWCSTVHAVSCYFFWQDEISGWTEDLFTARKSAINLLGVIALSKVVIPFIFLLVY